MTNPRGHRLQDARTPRVRRPRQALGCNLTSYPYGTAPDMGPSPLLGLAALEGCRQSREAPDPVQKLPGD